MTIDDGLLKRLVSAESLEPVVDGPSLYVVPLG
jgi:hypothetical protein